MVAVRRRQKQRAAATALLAVTCVCPPRRQRISCLRSSVKGGQISCCRFSVFFFLHFHLVGHFSWFNFESRTHGRLRCFEVLRCHLWVGRSRRARSGQQAQSARRAVLPQKERRCFQNHFICGAHSLLPLAMRPPTIYGYSVHPVWYTAIKLCLRFKMHFSFLYSITVYLPSTI